MNDFLTPPNHEGFIAKRLFDDVGTIKWGAIAHIEPNGGGPIGNHTHKENHLFIVVEGEARVVLGEKEHIVHKDDSLLIDGMIPHSIWNNTNQQTTVIKLNLERK